MEFSYGDLESTIVEAVRSRCECRDVAVAFSGGLDSGLISALAKRYASSVHLYTCGTANAFDVAMARDLSAKLELPWTHVQISKGNVEGCIRRMIAATGESDPFTISYELPLFCVCEAAEEDVVLSGQGSDEYFMGCAKYVGCSDGDYQAYVRDGVERLMSVSVPCEERIAAHFGKEMAYPYLDTAVVDEVGRLDPEDLRPKDMDSRKAVLKAVAVHLGYGVLADRRKKSSQYGSGATDLIRALAREREMMFNRYIQSLYEDEMEGRSSDHRGSVVNARVDSVLRAKAEDAIRRSGMTVSQAIELFYRRVVEEDGPGFLRR